jgi:hypothetical protein
MASARTTAGNRFEFIAEKGRNVLRPFPLVCFVLGTV